MEMRRTWPDVTGRRTTTLVRGTLLLPRLASSVAIISSLAMASLPACLQFGQDVSSDAGAVGANVAGGDAARETAALTGDKCAIDSISGVTLCTKISLCPGLLVDHDLYPDCGFRLPGASIDLVCVCGEVICPVGVALDCAQAKELLDTQSESAVCVQQAEGRCAPRSPAKPGRAPSCDANCAAECGADVSCRKICGC